jgi:FAD/FMN-containing dehydrogenase
MVAKTNKLNKVYETDASQITGKAAEIIIPETIADLQIAIKKNSNITPRGAGTGLSGGAVPLGGVIIDMSKFNKIIKLDRVRGFVEVEAGCVLDELNALLEENGSEFPVQPSSHAVCTIGGMIATDAVGSRAVKYGRTSKWVEWIEVMNNEGVLHRKGKTELSEFAGLEGTTGIILNAGLRIIQKPERTITILKKSTIEEVMIAVRELKRNQSVSMIELFSKDVSSWLGLGEFYHLLVEYESGEGSMIGDDYDRALELRDQIYPKLAERGYITIEDPKLFLDKIPQLIRWLEYYKIPYYGHVSVGIIHPCFAEDQKNLIPQMMKFIKRAGGQISGEHGIGLLKRDFVDEQDKKLFQLIKSRNDLGNKFNPGKIYED